MLKLGVPLLAMGLVANAHAQGTATMTLSDYSSYAEYNSSFTSYLNYGAPNQQKILNATGNDIIGLYSFSVAPGSVSALNTPFWTTCLSPNGLLDTASHTYDYDTFAQASPGLNPPSWSTVGKPDSGIQNANYLFSTLSGQILSGSGILGQGSLQDQGAALALAMYDALYNSTGYGAIAGTPFAIPGLQTGDPNVYNDYTADLAVVTGAKINPVAGAVLVPDPVIEGSAAQDMILLGTGLPQGSPVPEPATIFTGLLLLLPLGACALRILRKGGAP